MAQPTQVEEDEVLDLAEDEIVIEEEFLHLPKEIATTLSDPAFDVYSSAVAKKHNIPEEKYFDLALCTQYVMSGETAPSEYVKELMTILDIDQPKAALIAQEINKDLFSPLKNALKELHGLNKNDSVKKEESTPASPLAKESAESPAITAPPVTPASEEKQVMNNLESKLGSAFAIKKDILFTQPGAPTPVATPEVVLPLPPQIKETPAQGTAPTTPTTTAGVDVYREAV